ncbi:MAG: hypothetical protein QOG43_3302 [Actinomycetota bacterium]|nr:hypothetical protein [Actinomycetota bacterium]
MADDADRSGKLKGLVAKAKNAVGGGEGDDDASANDGGGAMSKVKAALSKATSAVTKVVKKDDDGGIDVPTPPAAEGAPTDNARQMKAAVEAARKAKPDD